MKVEKKELPKSQIELSVAVEVAELQPYLEQAANDLSQDMPIEGFRPGKAPYEVMKNKVGELPVMETAARLLVNKKMDQLITENIQGQVVGTPQVNITRLAPGNALGFKVVLALLPEVTLGNYKDLGISLETVKVADSEIEKMIDHLRQHQAKEVTVDRPIQANDKAVVDIKMFLDKVPVEGGQSQDTAVILGHDYIIPGFDQQLLGAKKGETKDFDLVYPTEHHQSNLAGKKVAFTVIIKDVFERELPEVNDEWAKNLGLQSLAEMKDNIKKSIEQEKQTKADQKAELAMLEKIIANTTFSDIPDSLMDNEINLMFQEMEYHLSVQGAALNDYLQSINKTKEDLAKEFQPEALKRLRSALVIRTIAEQEKFTATDEEIQKEIDHLLSHYPDNQEIQTRIKSAAYRHHLQSQIAHQKALAQLRLWNIK